MAKVEFHFEELFPRVGFIVTNLETPSRAVVRFYNKRGKAEQWIKEGKQAVKMTRLSCHRFRSNQVRLALSLLAYNTLCSIPRTTWFVSPPADVAAPTRCNVRSMSTVDRAALKRSSSA